MAKKTKKDKTKSAEVQRVRVPDEFPLVKDLAVALESCTPGDRCKLSLCPHCRDAAKRYFGRICFADGSRMFQSAFVPRYSPTTIERVLEVFDLAKKSQHQR